VPCTAGLQETTPPLGPDHLGNDQVRAFLAHQIEKHGALLVACTTSKVLAVRGV
jgi:hypothetical protein